MLPGTAFCRICLAAQRDGSQAQPFIDLTLDCKREKEIVMLLGLQTWTEETNSYPQHLCTACSEKILVFTELKQAALENELFIEKYQTEIKSEGLSNVLQNLEIASSTETNQQYQCTDEKVPPNQQTNKLKCDICQVSFDSARILKNHMRTSHGKRAKCDLCGLVFQRKNSLAKHKLLVHDDHRSECNICGKRVKDLSYHKRSAHQNVTYDCALCGKKYKSKNSLEYHETTVHGGGDKQVCQYCAAELSSKSMAIHIKLKHSGKVERTEKCADVHCSKTFRTRTQADIHYKAMHLNVKYKCKYCGCEFKNLDSHIKQVHTHSKQFTCDQCGKSFAKKNDLKLHKERIHEQKRYACPVCGKKLSKILEHLKRIHGLNDAKKEDLKVTSPEVLINDPEELSASIPATTPSLQAVTTSPSSPLLTTPNQPISRDSIRILAPNLGQPEAVVGSRMLQATLSLPVVTTQKPEMMVLTSIFN